MTVRGKASHPSSLTSSQVSGHERYTPFPHPGPPPPGVLRPHSATLAETFVECTPASWRQQGAQPPGFSGQGMKFPYLTPLQGHFLAPQQAGLSMVGAALVLEAGPCSLLIALLWEAGGPSPLGLGCPWGTWRGAEPALRGRGESGFPSGRVTSKDRDSGCKGLEAGTLLRNTPSWCLIC